MTVPENVRINLSAPFPTQVQGSGPVTISKQLGVWTVGFSTTKLGALSLNLDPTTITFLVYSSGTGTFYNITLAALSGQFFATRVVTAAGNIPVTPSDRVLLVAQTVPQAAYVILPAAASRNGTPLTIKDLAGVAAGFPLTLLPNGAETIDGQLSVPLNSNYQALTLYPIATGGWWIG
jgi:hypothetical protein